MQRPKSEPVTPPPAAPSQWNRLWSWLAPERPRPAAGGGGLSLDNGRFVELLPFGAQRGLYSGRDRLFGQPVLVRMLASAGFEDARRFHFESRLVGQIHSERVPPLVSLGLNGNRPYHVLRLPSPVRLLEPERVKPRNAPGLVRELVLALVSLHEQGVAYRNLRPETVVVAGDGQVLLIDFSCARRFGPERLVPALGEARPPGEYDAPEASAGPCDGPRADAYSLGVLAARLLGKPLAPALRALADADPEARPHTLRALLSEPALKH